MKKTLMSLAILSLLSAGAFAASNDNSNGPTNNTATATAQGGAGGAGGSGGIGYGGQGGMGGAGGSAIQGQAQGQQQAQGQGQSQSLKNDIRNTNTNANLNSNSNSNRNTNSNANFTSSGAASNAISGSKATSSSGGNALGQSAYISNDTDIRPAATAPSFALTSVGTDNCLGSASASVGNGFFALGGGTTTESVECNRRAYSRALRDLGEKDAAIALLCLNEEVAKVTKSCQKVAAVAAAPTPVASRSTQYDPYICKRTGTQCQ